jgi:hypothetical protein
MAIVRFSNELKELILKNADAVLAKQVQAARDARPTQEWGDKIYDKMFGQYVPMLNAVPPHFLNMVDRLKVNRVGMYDCSLEFTLTSKRAWPSQFLDNEFAKKGNSYDNGIDLKTHPDWEEFRQDVARWRDAITAAVDKQKEFRASVSKVIDAHATLAPALKMWPALWDLIPENVKDKHREVRERIKKEVDVDVNLGALTAAVTFNKMTR